jgi:hypothetical protein
MERVKDKHRGIRFVDMYLITCTLVAISATAGVCSRPGRHTSRPDPGLSGGCGAPTAREGAGAASQGGVCGQGRAGG